MNDFSEHTLRYLIYVGEQTAKRNAKGVVTPSDFMVLETAREAAQELALRTIGLVA